MSDRAAAYQISEFRNHVPELFDQVTAHPDQVVRVVRRGSQEGAVMLSESAYVQLRERVRALQQQLAQALKAKESPAIFRLIGSAALRVPAEAVLSASRAEQAALADAKRRAF